jgi:hypothetical protein
MAITAPDAEGLCHGTVSRARALDLLDLVKTWVDTPAEGAALLVLALKTMSEVNDLSPDEAIAEIALIYRSLTRIPEHKS